MHRTRIKFCGITREKDAQYATRLGVDALGLMFYQSSRRYVSVVQANRVIASLPPLVTLVGVFVNPTHAEVEQILSSVPINLLQFHGEETATFCNSFAVPYIKAIRMQPGIQLEQMATIYSTAQALLLDSYHPTTQGGTGICFDWELVPKRLALPVILSGGLTVSNVKPAITQLHPYAVDVSTGIETTPGIKNLQKMHHFVAAVA